MRVSQFLSLNIGGTKLTRSKIKEILLAEYKDEMIVISFPGLANILIFKRKANEMLRIQKKDNQDEIHPRICCQVNRQKYQRHFM